MLRCFLLFLFFIVHVHALPLSVRQPAAAVAAPQPTSVTTVQTTNTPEGLLTQTCVIVFTPFKNAQGQDEVREVKTCTFQKQTSAVPPATPASNPTNAPAPLPKTATAGPPVVATTSANPSASSAAASAPASSGVAVVSTSSVQVSPSAPASSVASAVATAVSASSSSAIVVATAVSASSSSAIVVGTTSISSQPSSSPLPPSPLSSSVSPVNSPTGSPVVVIGSTKTPVVSTAPAASTPVAAASGSAAAEASPSTSAAFTLPGKKLSVLPIGLGVFAGISVIALIVVGLVTYERTKYRKAFRQRKLAESGAAMGYGGNTMV